ncbi:SH3 domain-containing protein [Bacillus thuringiensis]|uniref:SH3 domain-containing protein n=1 Tax=Bacillus thuringiensis TaxID=1428 RepID=UPI00333889F0
MRQLSKYMTTLAVASTSIGFSVDTVNASGNNLHTVNTNVLNVRSTSSTAGSIVGRLYNGNQVNLLEKMVNGWSKVEYNGNIAYVKTDFITTNQNTLNKKYKVTASALNVRSGAGTKFQILGILPYNQVVTVVDSTNGWYKIQFNGRHGYVKDTFLTASDNSKSNPTSNSTISSQGKALVNHYFDVIGPIIEAEANQKGIPEWTELIKAITMQESSGNYMKYPDVMQSSEGTCGEIKCLTDYKQSIQNGVTIFKNRMQTASDMFDGDIRMGIQAYNYGPYFLKKSKDWGATEYSEELSQRYSNYLKEHYGFSGDPLYVQHVLSHYRNP